MRIGVATFLTDRSPAPARVAVAAEERGFKSLYLPEHTHLPAGEADPPSLVAGVELEDYRRTLDPFVALAQAAAVTSRIRLGTGVCLVAQHDPVVLAKQLATLDHLSGGRVVFGVGFGWNRQEAADHGLDFRFRREVAREKVLCMEQLWSAKRAEFHGEFVELPPCFSWPKPVQQPRIPVWLGAGAGVKTFAAIAEYGDGWMPIGGAGITDALPALRRAMESAGRDPARLEVIPFGTIPDPGKLDHYRSIGVTEVVLRVPASSEATLMQTLDDYTKYVTVG